MENRKEYTDGAFFNCSVTDTNRLSESQIRDVQQLTELCCRHDRIHLSYPVAEVSGEEDSHHWLMHEDSGMLIAALGLVYYEDALAECTAFTHPKFRRQGLFEELLDLALENCQNRDILFPVSDSCPDTSAVLQALGAELDLQEFQMETALTASLSISAPAFSIHPDSSDLNSDLVTWQLFSKSAPNVLCGACQTSLVSASCVCLHHVEILPQFRGQGCGTALMELLFSSLYKDGIRRIVLQVSGSNAAALALYKKTGFHITETLSYYLY